MLHECCSAKCSVSVPGIAERGCTQIAELTGKTMACRLDSSFQARQNPRGSEMLSFQLINHIFDCRT